MKFYANARITSRNRAARMADLWIDTNSTMKAEPGVPDGAWFLPDAATVITSVNGRGVREVTLSGRRQTPASGDRPARLTNRRVARTYSADVLAAMPRRPLAIEAVFEAVKADWGTVGQGATPVSPFRVGSIGQTQAGGHVVDNATGWCSTHQRHEG